MGTLKKYIDLEQVIKDKNANLHRWLPRFVLSYIKRIMHEREINEVMAIVGHTYGLDYVYASLKELGVTVEVHGEENIPKQGGCVIASNHPLGGLDGVALMQAVSYVRTDMRFLVNDVLMSVKNFTPLFIPINKFGANARESLRKIDEAYASDLATLVFPAGMVSRKLSEGVADLPWAKSFISKAISHKRDVIPTYIDGGNSNFFYNLAKWRTKLGIKANLEMFYLVDELFKQKGRTIRIQFGKPISYQTFDKSKTPEEWAAVVREEVYKMATPKD